MKKTSDMFATDDSDSDSVSPEKRDSYNWQSYLSSALTIEDQKQRDEVLGLNKKIKNLLESKCDTFVYAPQDYSDPSRGDSMKPEEIYILDRWRIAESDFVLLNLDRPSFGVGQEAEIALSMGIPIIAFHYHSIRPSRIVKGIPVIFNANGYGVPSESVISYRDLDHKDLKEKLVAEVQKLQKSIPVTSEGPAAYPSFSKCLTHAMGEVHVDSAELAKRTGFSVAFINHLKADFDSVKSTLEPYDLLAKCRMRRIPIDRFLNPGLWVIRKLAEALGKRVYQLIGEDELDRIWHEPILAAAKKGVTLEEFMNVSNDAGFHVVYSEAARSSDSFAPEENVEERILSLVSKNRNAQ